MFLHTDHQDASFRVTFVRGIDESVRDKYQVVLRIIIVVP